MFQTNKERDVASWNIYYDWMKWKKFKLSVGRARLSLLSSPTANRSCFYEAINFLFQRRMNWNFEKCRPSVKLLKFFYKL